MALVHDHAHVTYGELHERSTRLAHRLIAAGAGPERLVGVCVERSAELVVAVIAILGSGAAYVPLDPRYPTERLAFMLADAAADIVVTSERARGAVPGAAVARIVLADEPAADPPARRPPPPVPVAPQNLAYVIYTSGSTGRPKGVAISHASASALLDWALDAYSPQELGGMLASTSLSFDLSVFELFAPLASGGRVILARDILALADLPAADEVTLVNTVPSALEQLLALEGELPPGVRTVNLAGEPLPGALVRRLYAMPGVRRVVNLYGPSEDTTYSTVAELGPHDERPPIGRPIGGTRAYVLDERLARVSGGVPGELYLGGAGLARCYLARPSLTAERFVADPFGTDGAVMYRTGDRVRYLRDGSLEFLGRTDQQVKLRGFRIELGEIEAVLRALAPVQACAVAVRASPGGDRRLVAYVVLAREHTTAAQLRRSLSERLPEHMVPGTFAILDALPLSPNGKLDRAALPDPWPEQPAAGAAPQGETERIVAGVWSEVLGARGVGRDAAFLALGGDSLSATKVVARLRGACAIELSLRDFLAHPTVAGVAATIERLRAAGAQAPAAPIQAAATQATEPSFAQQRLWVLDRLQPGSSYDVLYALRLSGALDVEALERALEAVVARHDVLRTTFAERDGVPRLVVAPAARIAPAIEDLRGLAPDRYEERRRAALEDLTAEAFDLEHGPLLRTSLLVRGDAEHELLLRVHHIAFDGWSMRVLMRDLAELYDARVSSLEPLAITYADFAAWQRSWLRGATLERLQDFWRASLAGAPAVLELPTDRPRSGARPRGANLRLTLDEPLGGDVRDFARARGVTLYATLLAGFELLLHDRCGAADLVIGSAAAGRDRLETEWLIGNFVNTLALRIDLRDDPAFTDVVARTSDAILAALSHQDLPFDKVVELVRAPRTPGISPVVQVAFGLEHERLPPIRCGAVELVADELFTGDARFDLTVWIHDDGGTLMAHWTYDALLFDASTVTRMHERFASLLGRAIADPGSRLSALTGADRGGSARPPKRTLAPREARPVPVVRASRA